MINRIIAERYHVGVLCLVALFVLAACERPDPNPVSAEEPVILPAISAPPAPAQTPAPMQVNVTIIMPTPVEGEQIMPSSVQVVVVTPTPEFEEAMPIEPQPPTPTRYPDNHYLGWIWADGLNRRDGESLLVSSNGAALWDRPSPESKQVGLVVGLSAVIQAGQSYCGYTPVLTHQSNMLLVKNPYLEIFEPATISRQNDSTGPISAVEEGTARGWAYIQAVKVTEDVAVAGLFGIIFRQDPCRYARSLGIVPAERQMTITGPQIGEYIPVRIANDTIQQLTDEKITEGATQEGVD